ncbi:MAG: spore coat protein [Ruminococcaceae bacterium]|nr:spore coat protein [Oscillospiraceae bacterium]
MADMTGYTFGEKEQMADLLASEKFLAGNYCSFLSECATPEVVSALSELLMDTHRMQQRIFVEMNSRGWYPVTKAQEQKIAEAKQKFGTKIPS